MSSSCITSLTLDQQSGQKYLVVALVNDQELPAFDGEMNVIDATVLDLEKLKHGVRVRMSGIDANDDGVVSLLSSKRAKEPAGYFTDFIGSEQFTNSAEMAAKLDERLEEWFVTQSLDDEGITAFKFKVYGHWKDSNGSKDGVSIESLGNALYPDDCKSFVDFMTEEENGIPGQLPPIRSRDMSRFRKFSHATAGLKLEYDKGGKFNWSGKVKVQGSNIVIEDAPDSLKEKILADG